MASIALDSVGPKLPAFSKWAMAAAAVLIAAPAAISGYSHWSQAETARMDRWQAEGIAQGVFTGSAPNSTSLVDPRGTHAEINAQAHKSPAVVEELLFSKVGDLFGPARGELHGRMTYFHERSHVEYQTAMGSRFDAPGLSPKDRAAVEAGLDLNDQGAYLAQRSRLHGAMHERFAEAYGALSLIHGAKQSELPEVGAFMRQRAAERSSSWESKTDGEFAHDLGRTMDAVVAMDQSQVRSMAPNQIKAAALRMASLAYIADAKGDKELSALLGPAMSGPASAALWKGAASLTGAQIAERAVAGLPPAEFPGHSAAPIKSLVFGSNASPAAVAPSKPIGAKM